MRSTETHASLVCGSTPRQFIVAVACVFFSFACSVSAGGEGAARSDLKQLELSRKSAELERISKELRTLERAKREFLMSQKACRKKLAGIEQRKADVDKALADIRLSLAELLKLEDSAILKPKDGHFKDLLTALRSLPRSGSSFIERRRAESMIDTEFSPDEAEAESVVKGLITEAREAMPEDKPTESLAFLERAKNFVVENEDDEVLKANIVEELKQIESGITKVSTETILTDMKSRQQPQCDALDSAIAGLETEIGNRAKLKADLETAVARLSDEIQSAADSSEARNKTLLTWATIGLIVVLPLLFLLMALFADPVKEKIIENRTLIELVSMAFLLLTIIMLGTANKLMPEAIGTLLGTIAGYIFGRHTFNGKDSENKT